jgi:hypothetical protein
MNKLMMYPLMILLILALVSLVYSNTSLGSGTVDIEDVGSWIVDASSITNVVLIITGAIGIVIAQGFSLFGTGFSNTSQSMTFNAIVFLGVWTLLTAAAFELTVSEPIFSFLWLALTLSYIIGLGEHVGGTSA